MFRETFFGSACKRERQQNNEVFHLVPHFQECSCVIYHIIILWTSWNISSFNCCCLELAIWWWWTVHFLYGSSTFDLITQKLLLLSDMAEMGGPRNYFFSGASLPPYNLVRWAIHPPQSAWGIAFTHCMHVAGINTVFLLRSH
jgi:hypothetical protein